MYLSYHNPQKLDISRYIVIFSSMIATRLEGGEVDLEEDKGEIELDLETRCDMTQY